MPSTWGLSFAGAKRCTMLVQQAPAAIGEREVEEDAERDAEQDSHDDAQAGEVQVVPEHREVGLVADDRRRDEHERDQRDAIEQAVDGDRAERGRLADALALAEDVGAGELTGAGGKHVVGHQPDDDHGVEAKRRRPSSRGAAGTASGRCGRAGRGSRRGARAGRGASPPAPRRSSSPGNWPQFFHTNHPSRTAVRPMPNQKPRLLSNKNSRGV